MLFWILKYAWWVRDVLVLVISLICSFEYKCIYLNFRIYWLNEVQLLFYLITVDFNFIFITPAYLQRLEITWLDGLGCMLFVSLSCWNTQIRLLILVKSDWSWLVEHAEHLIMFDIYQTWRISFHGVVLIRKGTRSLKEVESWRFERVSGLY